jgi:hypothetical protein
MQKTSKSVNRGRISRSAYILDDIPRLMRKTQSAAKLRASLRLIFFARLSCAIRVAEFHMANSILLSQRQFRRRKTPFCSWQLLFSTPHSACYFKDCSVRMQKAFHLGAMLIWYIGGVKKITRQQGDSKEMLSSSRWQDASEKSRCNMERASVDKIQTESQGQRGLFAARLLLICATCVPQDDAPLAPCVTSNWVGPQNWPHFSAPAARVSCSPVAAQNFTKVFPDQSIFHVRLTFCCVQNPKSFL